MECGEGHCDLAEGADVRVDAFGRVRPALECRMTNVEEPCKILAFSMCYSGRRGKRTVKAERLNVVRRRFRRVEKAC